LTSSVLPTAGAYRDAVDAGHVTFVSDSDLRAGSPVRDPLGMPKGISGNFATVFPIEAGNRRFAVKCFTRAVTQQQTRYKTISTALAKVSEPWRVEFLYLEQGIRVLGDVHPILKMEWVEGKGLVPFIESHLGDSDVLNDVGLQLLRCVNDLERHRMGHGDLQHGNILISPQGKLRLIDYDGMYVPGLESLGQSETGHRNFQSPLRAPSHWNSTVDRFGAWIIYSSLVCLATDASLWVRLRRDGDEALLFSAKDYLAPFGSEAIQVLTSHKSDTLRRIADLMLDVWTMSPDDIPPLREDAFRGGLQVPVAGVVSLGASGTPAGRPLWMEDATPTGSPVPTLGSAADAGWWATHEGIAATRGFETGNGADFLVAWLGLVLGPLGSMIAMVLRNTELRWLVWDDPLLLLGTGIAAVVGALAFLAFRYRRRPEAEERRRAVSLLETATLAARQRQNQLDEAKAVLSVIQNGMQEKEKAIEARYSARKQEVSGKIIAGEKGRKEAEFRCQKELGEINQRESGARRDALSAAVEAARRQYLQGCVIRRAFISDLSEIVISNLEGAGFLTAADLAGWRQVKGGRYMKAELQHPTKGWIHVSLVGLVRAEMLWNWVQREQVNAGRQVPTQLPAAAEAAIVARWRTTRSVIENRIALARVEHSREATALRSQLEECEGTHIAEREALRAEWGKRSPPVSEVVRRASTEAVMADVARTRAEGAVNRFREISFPKFLVTALVQRTASVP